MNAFGPCGSRFGLQVVEQFLRLVMPVRMGIPFHSFPEQPPRSFPGGFAAPRAQQLRQENPDRNISLIIFGFLELSVKGLRLAPV